MDRLWIIFYVVVLFTGGLIAKEEDISLEINHLELATMMVYDGKYDKAKQELDAVNQKAKNFDKARYYKLVAVLAVKDNNQKEAIMAFNHAIDATKKKVYIDPSTIVHKKRKKYLFSFMSKEKKEVKKKKPVFNPEKLRKEELSQLYIQLSQAYYKNKNYLETVEALNNAGKIGRDRASLFTLRADCYWKASKQTEALNALSEGVKLFQKDTTLLKQKLYYFAELQLYQSYIDTSKEYMKRKKVTPKEYLSLAQMLIGGHQKSEAIKILEEGIMKFPKDATLKVLLGHQYLQKGNIHTPATLFEEASIYETKYTKEASELFRRAKELPHALYLNTNVKDKVEKLKQKIAIYLDRGEFEKVIGLQDALKRYKILDDDNLRYALGYAYYMAKDYEGAEIHFKKINNNELFEKATIIRKNIEKCRGNSLECI